jgi:hypothetical protein
MPDGIALYSVNQFEPSSIRMIAMEGASYVHRIMGGRPEVAPTPSQEIEAGHQASAARCAEAEQMSAGPPLRD